MGAQRKQTQPWSIEGLGPLCPTGGRDPRCSPGLNRGHTDSSEKETASLNALFGGSSLQRAFKEWGAHDGCPLLCEKAAGAAGPLSTDLVSSPKQDMDEDSLGRTLEGVD